MRERKIALVVKKGSFEDVENADNIYWANTNEVQRFRALIDHRKTFFKANERIQKIVFKKSLYEKKANKS